MNPKQITEAEINFVHNLQSYMFGSMGNLDYNKSNDFFIIFLFDYAGKYTSQIFNQAKNKFEELFR
jgi:hypothetical protein